MENIMYNGEKPCNCSECEYYDGTCLLSPKNWEIWRLMEQRRPLWCPLDEEQTKEASGLLTED